MINGLAGRFARAAFHERLNFSASLATLSRNSLRFERNSRISVILLSDTDLRMNGEKKPSSWLQQPRTRCFSRFCRPMEPSLTDYARDYDGRRPNFRFNYHKRRRLVKCQSIVGVYYGLWSHATSLAHPIARETFFSVVGDAAEA